MKGVFFAVFAGLCEITIIPVNFARVWSDFMYGCLCVVT